MHPLDSQIYQDPNRSNSGDRQNLVKTREALSSAREAASQLGKAQRRARTTEYPTTSSYLSTLMPHDTMSNAHTNMPIFTLPTMVPPTHDPMTSIQSKLWMGPEQAAYLDACHKAMKTHQQSTMGGHSTLSNSLLITNHPPITYSDVDLSKICEPLGSARNPLEVRSLTYAFLCGLQCIYFDEMDGSRSRVHLDLNSISPHPNTLPVAPPPSSLSRPWSVEEDEILERSVVMRFPYVPALQPTSLLKPSSLKENSEQLWVEVAGCLHGRTAQECRARFEQTILDIARLSSNLTP